MRTPDRQILIVQQDNKYHIYLFVNESINKRTILTTHLATLFGVVYYKSIPPPPPQYPDYSPLDSLGMSATFQYL